MNPSGVPFSGMFTDIFGEHTLHSHRHENLNLNNESIWLLEMETALHNLQDLLFTIHYLFAQYQEDLNHNRRMQRVIQILSRIILQQSVKWIKKFLFYL
jgi:hypothetical protein